MKKLVFILPILFLWFPNVSHAAWVAEETFESYADGNDLNTLSGGSGWDGAWGSTASKVFITNSSPGQGSLSATETNQSVDLFRTLTTAVSSGVMYFMMMRTDTGATDTSLTLKDGANYFALFTFEGGNIKTQGAITTTLVTGYTGGLWYYFEVTIIDTDHYSVRYSSDHTTWSTSTGSLDTNSSTSITSVHINAGGGTQTAKYDNISATSPIAPPVVDAATSILGLVRSLWIN